MKATELRIGNLVSDGTYRYRISVLEYDKIQGLSNENNNYPDSPYHLHEEDLKGIPLTEEWLVKFGFNIKKAIWFSIKTKTVWVRFEISIKDKRCILFDTKGFDFCDMIFPKYVHQLQNLYFALTGEELILQQ